MQFNKILVLSIASTITLGSTVFSQAENVPFVGGVLNSDTCTLIIDNPGVLAVNTGGNVLGSKEAGGVKGTVSALANGTDFDISVASPTNFTQIPAGSDASSTFASTYFMTGATNTAETTEAATTAINNGASIVHIDLTATKTSGTYATGIYAAPVNVTCE